MASRTHIGTEALRSAQQSAGLSNEKIAARIDITEKTWRRWKASGDIPAYAQRAVEDALGVTFEDRPTSMSELLTRLRAIEALIPDLARGDDVQRSLLSLQEQLDVLARRRNGQEIQTRT